MFETEEYDQVGYKLPLLPPHSLRRTTATLIYRRTGNLHEQVRRNANGRPTRKLTQLLTPEEGKPRLRELLEGVKLLMRMSSNWVEFMQKMDEYYPKVGGTQQLPLRGGAAQLPSPD